MVENIDSSFIEQIDLNNLSFGVHKLDGVSSVIGSNPNGKFVERIIKKHHVKLPLVFPYWDWMTLGSLYVKDNKIYGIIKKIIDKNAYYVPTYEFINLVNWIEKNE